MKTQTPPRLRALTSLLVLAMSGLAHPSASAATLTFSTTAPTPGAHDVHNLTGAANDGGNVRDGGTYADGAGNDAFTYVANDRANQGQTFTTGSNTAGYAVAAVWLQHAGYTSNTNATWYCQATNATYRIRMTRPGQVGTAGFVVDDETYTITGTEPNKLPGTVTNSPNGTGTWLKFAFATPVVLSPNTAYGFDLSTGSGNAFFELAGTSTDSVPGGSAYKGTVLGGSPDTTLTALNGDRVFLVELAPVVPAPSFIGQPSSYTGHVGDNVTLVSSATGDPAPGYQWQKSTDGGSTWTDVGGATSASLTFSPATYANNGLYRVVASNTGGSVTSNEVSVALTYAAPTITSGSSSATVLDGTEVDLSVSATGVGTLAYQWYLEGSPISGATTSTLDLGNVSPATAGTYSVVITDPAGVADGFPAATTTREIELTVISSSVATVAYYRFEDGPAASNIGGATDTTANANTLSATGSPTYSTNVPAATVPRTGTGNLLAANFPSTASNNGLVAATGGPLAATPFTDFTIEFYVRLGSLAGWQTFVGRADSGNPGDGVGPEALLYIQKAGGVTGTGLNNAFRVELITKDSRNLQLHSQYVPSIDTWYHVAVVGSSLDGTLALYVNGALVQSVNGFNGLFVPPSGSDTPWLLGRGEFADGAGDFFQGQLDEVRFSQVALPPSRFLRSDSDSNLPPPVITAAPQHATARSGTNASFTVAATGQGNLSYQWYHNGNPLSGQTAATLDLTGVAAGNAGTYSVTVSDDAGVSSGFPPTTATAQTTLQVVDVPLPSRAIGLNFVGAGDSTLNANYTSDLGTFASDESAGFLPVANWVNSASVTSVATSPAPLALVENTGSSTVATATWSSANTWSAHVSGGAAASKTADRRLFHGYIESRATTGASVTVSNIPYASYDVYVYVAGGGSGNVGSLRVDRVGSPTYYYRLISHDTFNGSTSPLPYMLGAAESREAALAAPPATFVRFAAVTGSDLTISAIDQTVNSNAGGIAAVQIVDRTPAGTPYPPSVTSAPVSALKAGGASATLSVTAVSNNSGGVLSYQWQKDGSNLPGQTSATLNLSALTGAATGNYSVIVTDTSPLGTSSVTRTASLVVVDGTRSVLINGDLNIAASPTYVGEGILRADGTDAYTDFEPSATVWNGILGAAGSATRTLTAESSGLALSGVTFSYAGADGAEDNTALGDIHDGTNPTPAMNLERDYLFANYSATPPATPFTATVGGLQALAGKKALLRVYAVGKTTKTFGATTTAPVNDTAQVSLATPNNHLNSPAGYTSVYGIMGTQDAGRNIEYNNPQITTANFGVATSAYVSFTGVVSAEGTVSWTLSPDTRPEGGGLVPLVGFQLLVTGEDIAPAAPTGVSATAGSGQVSLSWTASDGATSYNVRRSTTSGSGYTTLVTGLTGTSHTDNTVTAGTTYYYVVTAVKSSPPSESGYSAEVSATAGSTATALQTWRQTNFGTTENTGNAANTADPDADGQSNLLEYALGTNPNTAGALPVSVARVGDALTLSFSRIGDPTLVYKIEASNDLTSWTPAFTYAPFNTAGNTTYTDTVTLTAQPRRFLRLVVTAP